MILGKKVQKKIIGEKEYPNKMYLIVYTLHKKQKKNRINRLFSNKYYKLKLV